MCGISGAVSLPDGVAREGVELQLACQHHRGPDRQPVLGNHRTAAVEIAFGVVFASEIKGVVAHPDVPCQLGNQRGGPADHLRGRPDCDAADLLRDHPGCYVLRPDDVNGITTALSDCRGERHPRDVSGFTRAALTETLAEVLEHASSAAPTQ
jgi:hypothetical protein